MEEDTSDRSGTGAQFARRTVLQIAGGTAAGLAVVSGTASAHQSQFYGCTQVCSGTMNNLAVVKTAEGDFECRWMDRESERRNQDWSGTQHCYELSGDEQAVVGMIEKDRIEDEDGNVTKECVLCENPNRCAQNYYDSRDQIMADLEGNGTCVDVDGRRACDEFHEPGSEDCEVSGSSGGDGSGGGGGNGGRGGGNNGNS